MHTSKPTCMKLLPRPVFGCLSCVCRAHPPAHLGPAAPPLAETGSWYQTRWARPAGRRCGGGNSDDTASQHDARCIATSAVPAAVGRCSPPAVCVPASLPAATAAAAGWAPARPPHTHSPPAGIRRGKRHVRMQVPQQPMGLPTRFCVSPSWPKSQAACLQVRQHRAVVAGVVPEPQVLVNAGRYAALCLQLGKMLGRLGHRHAYKGGGGAHAWQAQKRARRGSGGSAGSVGGQAALPMGSFA